MPRRRRPAARPAPLPWDAVYPTLDLHGHTADEAHERARRWLTERQAQGDRTVRIITGKGLHSAGLPVLPGTIEALLRSLRGTVVARSAPEPGGGVFRVELRAPVAPRRAPRPGRPAPPVPDLSPEGELHRRAEETLWELGITPTPELIAAEVRRLRREAGGSG
jgi:hypothetical protein